MKTLIINSYRVDSELKIAPYVEIVKKFSSFRIITDVELFSHIDYIDYDAFILSGSADLITRGAYSKTYVEFLRYNTIPCFGVCYGHQILAKAFGASIFAGLNRIDGNETVRIIRQDPIFKDLPPEILVRQNHIEHVTTGDLAGAGFQVLANSPTCEVEAIKHLERLFYGVQFHPERSGVIGETIFKNFFDIVRDSKNQLKSSGSL
jgi:GMP synthase (glutamine-hydrolysing)